MKFVLLSVVCLFAVALAKPASTKQKRDILPGDPRYGTDYHHHHHHHHEHQSHENEVEPPHTAYGPPNHTPGELIQYPATQDGYVPPVHQYHQQQQQQQQVQLPSYNQQQTSIPTYQQSANNQYLGPVAQHHQVQYATPQVHYTTPVPYYTTAPQYTVSVPQYKPDVPVHNDYLPPFQVQKKTVEGPITSYGTPAPQYQIPKVQPTVEHHDHHVVTDVKSTILGDVSPAPETQDEEVVQQEEVLEDEAQQAEIQQDEVQQQEETVQETPVQDEVQTYDAPVQQRVETYHQETPVKQKLEHTYHHEAPVHSHTHSEAHSHTQVKTAVHTINNAQEQVKHVHHVQPVVHHAVQPTAYHKAVQHTVQQPAVQHHVVYQAAQTPQTYSSNHYGSGFDNFGTLDSAFQSTYGTPNFQVSQIVPQVYTSNFDNLGFGYQQDTNVFGQQYQQSVITAPQIKLHRYAQPQIPQIPQQIGGYVQNPVVPQIPSYQPTTQVVQQPIVKSTQLVDPQNGGYVY